jgi:AcrR family transcriptional regulator
MARLGRRPGRQSTRSVILDVARRRFAHAGFDSTSLRTIAADAGVDPAAVLHFFGSKDGLFREAVGWPFDPARIEAQLADTASGTLGVRLARAFLGYWDDPETGAALSSLLRSAMTRAEVAAMLREFVVREAFGRVAARLHGPEAELRANLAAGQLIGVVLLRDILQVEPLASTPTDEIISWLAPALDGYLGER